MALSALSSNAVAQTCGIPGLDGPATPSGVINSYHGGSGTASSGSNTVTVASISGLRSSNRTLRAGDQVLIIQMQDGNTPANAGLHEYALISAVAGNVLTLNRNLTNSYTQSASSNVVRTFQVVYVPQYSSAVLSGAVNPDAYTMNTVTGVVTGGIVAMDVAGSLNFTGSINASGTGFRGGAGLNGTGNRAAGSLFSDADYAFSTAAPNGALKGEGTAGTPVQVFNGTATPLNYAGLFTQGYNLGAGGRAAQGNAGGAGNDGEPVAGGNQYNSGGGGGSNGGSGGQGGFSWAQQNDAGGRGAGAIAASISRLVLGGGGGAGSSNNNGNTNAVTTWPPIDTLTTRPAPTATGTVNGADGAITVSGASGGGMVLIRAGTLTGGGTINADGYTAYNTSGGSEGAGGGGAGGTVVVLAGNGTSGALTINVNGGKGGYSNYYDHGPGGGGGGGVAITNFSTATINRAGGANGNDGCCGGAQGNSSPKAYSSTVGTIGISSTAGGTPPGLQSGADCLPNLQVTKTALQSTITSATGASTTYALSLRNAGGAATNVYLLDANLPPGWSYAIAPTTTYAYSPVPPDAASAGAETTAATIGGTLPIANYATANAGAAISLRANGAAPGVVPTAGANSPTFGSFFIPQNGAITVTYSVSIPDTATVGTYHNPAGVVYLDPTRLAASALRVVSPVSNVTANRTGTAYAANTTFASGSTTNVVGSNYSGLAAGPASEDVTLLPDLSVSKSVSTTTFTVGASSQSYIIVVRNNGRPVADQVYASTQATSQSATALVSSIPTLTDTLPTGMTLSTITNSAPGVWTCTPNGSSTTFSCSASSAVYPMAASSNLVTITATVGVSSAACPGPQTNTVGLTVAAIGESTTGNNTATVATPLSCSANLSITKTNNVTTLTAGSTTTYTVTVSNLGPAAADGAVVRDTPSVGLSSCSVIACTPSGTGVCPLAVQWPNIFSGGGLVLGSFASGAGLNFSIRCGVSATGQ